MTSFILSQGANPFRGISTRKNDILVCANKANLDVNLYDIKIVNNLWYNIYRRQKMNEEIKAQINILTIAVENLTDLYNDSNHYILENIGKIIKNMDDLNACVKMNEKNITEIQQKLNNTCQSVTVAI